MGIETQTEVDYESFGSAFGVHWRLNAQRQLGGGEFHLALDGSRIEDSTGTERKEKEASSFARNIVDRSLNVLIHSRFEITEKTGWKCGKSSKKIR